MERKLWNNLTAGRSIETISNALPETERREVLLAPSLLVATQSATWQWGMTIDDRWLAGMAVMPDMCGEGRGWFVSYRSSECDSAFLIRPMFQLLRDLCRLGPYHELRAWVAHGAAREERFASWFGFELDTGPASGFSPSGRDMNLWLWRRK